MALTEVTVDCSAINESGAAAPTETVREMSAEEEAAFAAVRAAHQAEDAVREQAARAASAQRQADQQAVIAGLTALGQPDAAAALARLLGVS